ncbi:MAG TPA: hypothetical protein VM686_00840 [Polyangiaceae bacterium]|jgi:hypothetical protein|nr:hypothetical protein [Polyangiaceae bacterium]
MTTDATLTNACAALIAEAAKATTTERSRALLAATGAVLDALQSAGGPAPALLLDALRTLPPLGAAWIAITLGSAVEQGSSPASSAPAVVDLMRRWLDAMPDDDEDVLPRDVVAAFPWLGQSLVTHLVRAPELRAVLARDVRLREQLLRASGATYGAAWVQELILRQSGELIVLHVESRRALVLRYENVGRVFHLFTLLQGAIGTRLPGGREPDLEQVQAAMGGERSPHNDSAWWHYQDGFTSKADFMSSLWAEWSVSDVPQLDGVTVLVLWPPILGGRHWDSSFFGPALDAAPPRVTIVRELDSAEAEAWFLRVRIAPR